jgi:Uma2 family endonuclease
MIAFEEFCREVSDWEKADLIGGAIHRVPPDTQTENQLLGFLVATINGFLEANDIAGQLLFSRFAFRLSEFDAVEPDIAYVRSNQLHLLGECYMEGGPDIAIEIVSRDSEQRDYGEKCDLYEAAGVEEYWIVDPRQQRVQFLRLKNGRYELAPLEENRIFKSSVIPGFWLDVNWLLARPISKAYHCLEEILATPAKPPRKKKR